MKDKILHLFFVLIGAIIGVAFFSFNQLVKAEGDTPPSTVFTYQGRLLKDNHAITGMTCDFQFGLYDAFTGGNLLGTGVQATPSVQVTDGYFTVNLDFGAVFDGNLRYLETSVLCPGDAAYNLLMPRVTLYGAPYANNVPWEGILNMPAGFADGTDDGQSYTAGNGLAIDATNVISVSFGGVNDDFGAAVSVARSDHAHDGRYFTESEADTRFVNADESAGGDLSGTYPDLTVAGIQGLPITTTAPITDQVLKWNGNNWGPAAVSGETYTAGSGISIDSGVISTTYGGTGSASTLARSDHNHDSTYINSDETAGGDISGTYTDLTVAGLQGLPITTTAPTTDQVLKWNGSIWIPAADSGETYTAGSGISISSGAISAVFAGTGSATTMARSDHNHDSTYINSGEAAGGDLTGTYPNPTIAGNAVGSSEITDGSIATSDLASAVYGGTGSASTLARSDHNHDSTYINSGEAAGGDLTGTYPNPTIAGNAVGSSEITDGSIATSDLASAVYGGTGSASTLARSDHNHDSTYINDGESAGGDLTGTYPNPTIASDAVGSNEIAADAVSMSEIDGVLGAGYTGVVYSTAIASLANYAYPSSGSFTPSANGQCLVIASVNVYSTGSQNALEAWIRVAKTIDSYNYAGNNRVYMPPVSNNLSSATISDIINVTAGQLTNLGCYIYADDSSWTDDDYWYCNVAYICQ